MNKPNLFNYATSELSQDALICYILEWAKIENKEIDEKLHNLGVNFLTSLFNKFENIKTPIEYKEILIKKQDNNIDVLCIVDGYAIIIEDKTNTVNHSNQLEKYLNIIQKDFDKTKILPVYFKTGDQGSYQSVIDNMYEIYTRQDFLKVLISNNYQNDIIENYKDYLQNIEDDVNSFMSGSLDSWTWNSWKGFYIHLQKELGEGNWDYVANPSGGFLGFWWAYQGDDNLCEQYLQLEQNKFCFKIWVKNKEEQKELRLKWYKLIKEKGKEYNLDLIKPTRFGTGKYMTVCILRGEYRKMKNEIFDMSETIKEIRIAKELLGSLLESSK